jgi:hypothetical protein
MPNIILYSQAWFKDNKIPEKNEKDQKEGAASIWKVQKNILCMWQYPSTKQAREYKIIFMIFHRMIFQEGECPKARGSNEEERLTGFVNPRPW